MGFYDLNIPYLEGSSAKSVSSLKAARLKLCARAMELGYSGVAYSRTLGGVMSDSDRCSISPFSLLNLAPEIESSARFHRELLGIPRDSLFRQYTRLNVTIETDAQATFLNSGNPILKTYDLVSVQPLNQSAFDQACQTLEADMITVDLSSRLLFRIKQPMVKAAIKRGVYFEIGYSGLVSGVQTRKHVITNAKLLVEWCRGKNLIISSGARGPEGLRGPYDVANLSGLFGLSVGDAKAALSRNCTSLVMKSTRKKKFYKEALMVEAITAVEPIEQWMKWDPLSSGGGGGDLLLLDDMANFFDGVNKAATASVAVTAPAVNSRAANGADSPIGSKERSIVAAAAGVTASGSSVGTCSGVRREQPRRKRRRTGAMMTRLLSFPFKGFSKRARCR